MATWAYPPLPTEEINREADTALVRNPLLQYSDIVQILWSVECPCPFSLNI